MMRLGIFVPSLSCFDAVGNDVLMMAEEARHLGWNVEVFATDIEDGIEGVNYFTEAAHFLSNPENIAIYHHATFSKMGEEIASAKAMKVFRYHNITPPEFFIEYDEIAQELCLRGREQVSCLVNQFDWLWPASMYNERELFHVFGARAQASAVIPPFHRIDRWDCVEALPPSNVDLDKSKLRILNVGRLSPNKNHDLLLDVLADYIQEYDAHCRLDIVGKIDPPNYFDHIKKRISDLSITQHVGLYTGGIPESQLKWFYEQSDLFMTTSKHEGFCVPVIEAMKFGVPIISTPDCALNETVDSYGIVAELEDVTWLSSAIHVANQPTTRKQLSNCARKGYARYASHRIISYFDDAMTNLSKTHKFSASI